MGYSTEKFIPVAFVNLTQANPAESGPCFVDHRIELGGDWPPWSQESLLAAIGDDASIDLNVDLPAWLRQRYRMINLLRWVPLYTPSYEDYYKYVDVYFSAGEGDDVTWDFFQNMWYMQDYYPGNYPGWKEWITLTKMTAYNGEPEYIGWAREWRNVSAENPNFGQAVPLNGQLCAYLPESVTGPWRLLKAAPFSSTDETIPFGDLPNTIALQRPELEQVLSIGTPRFVYQFYFSFKNY